MSENEENKMPASQDAAPDNTADKADAKEQTYSLNDDRRVKVLSPGMLVTKRFIRNRMAVTGLAVLVFMFVFSFIGGLLSPYTEDQRFLKFSEQNVIRAGAKENTEGRYLTVEGEDARFSGLAKAYFSMYAKGEDATYDVTDGKIKTTYTVHYVGGNYYTLAHEDGTVIGAMYKDVISASDGITTFPVAFQMAAQEAYATGAASFTVGDKTYGMDDDSILDGETEIAFFSRYSINPMSEDVALTRDFKDALVDALETYKDAPKDGEGRMSFPYVDETGETVNYKIKFNPEKNMYEIWLSQIVEKLDIYGAPCKEHWLGTDGNGMDMLTRLMYGGRVSLMIGFIVEIIETSIGVVMGGISGYFGGWVDNLIMRIVDVLYCIPSTPILIIIGAAMDQYRVDPQVRMILLMLILGILGWPGIARLVRGQILSLREQEFMTATEACGLSTSHKIFKHLIPNVIPQLIVTCTMGLGGVIITESTLSFLGLGVRFPFASWGNIISDVTNTFVLTSYWFVWIPAGIALLATVLAFNLVGDGLRDAFDPRMKR